MNVENHRRANARWARSAVAVVAIVFAAVASLSLVAVPKAQAAPPVLTVTPITWNVIGLDSNTPATGPNRFPVGARVCNAAGADPATNVTAVFAWDSSNPYVNLRPGSLSSVSVGSIDGGTCADAYFEVEVTTIAAAFDTTRRYHITATDSVTSATGTTPKPRELYVEHLISQNRNGVTSIKLNGATIAAGGSMTLIVGNTYTIELAGYTATQGYNQLEAFINFPNTVFRTLAVSTTYSADSSSYVASPNSKMYADACLWDNDPNSPNYRSCIGDDGKAGGTVVTTYTVKILSGAGTTESLNSLLYDFSGSSYHYNADYSLSARLVQIVSPASVTISKQFTPKTIAPGGTSAMTFVISNPTAETINGVNFTDTLLGGLQIAGTPNASYSGCGAGAFVPAPLAAATSLSFTGGSLTPNSVCTISVNVTAPEGTYPNTTSHLFIEGTTDTGNFGEATLVAASAPSCTAGQTLASWTVPTGTVANPPDTTGGLPTIKASNVSTAVASANVPLNTSIITSSGQGDSTSWSTWGYSTGGQFIQFVVDTSRYSGIFMDFYVSNPNVGNSPTSLKLSYSTGAGFTTLPTEFIPGAAFTLRTQDFSGLTSTTGNTTFRLTGSGAPNNQSGANLDYDNIRFYGCATPAPAPTITKSFAPDPIVKGAASTLTFTIANTAASSVALTGVAFTDVLPAGLSVADSSTTQCGGGTLTTTQTSRTIGLTGGSLASNTTCAFDVVVTGSTQGQYENVSGYVSSTQTGTTTNYATDSLMVIAPPDFAKSFSPGSVLLGGTSTLSFSISNANQSTTLTGINFTDTLPAGVTVASSTTPMCNGTLTATAPDTIALTGASLLANASCAFDVVVTSTSSGSKLNTTTAITSTEGGNGPSATATLLVNEPTAIVDLNKQVSTDNISWSKFTMVATGSAVYYRFAVYNGGDVAMNTISVNDPTLATTAADPAACSWTSVTPLLPGDSAYCVRGPITAISGSQLNTATATGLHNTGSATSSPSSATYATPDLTIAKSALETQFLAAGDVLHYSYLVTNTGSAPLLGPVVVTDDKSTDEGCPAVETIGDLDNYLDPGESITCAATYAVQSADVTAGSVTNTAFATVDGVNSPTDQVTVPLFVPAPQLTLVKSGTPLTYDSVGDVVSYSYLVTNSGNVTLSGPFTVSDDQATDESCPTTASLAPGASITCTATDTVTQQDLDAGAIVNTASVSNDTVTSSTDSATVTATQTPALSIAKTALPATYDAVGDVVSYSYLVTNSGNVTLSGPFTVSDDQATDESCPATATLVPGASITCTATDTVTQQDLDSGTIVNVASVSNGTVTSATDTETVTATQTPALSMVKTASPSTYDSVGDVIGYSYLVTNSGNVTLSGPFTVSDDQATDESCPAAATLAPGASITCTATDTVTQQDIDDGSIINIASASNGTTTSATDTETVTAVLLPALTLVKTAPPATYDSVGDVINYSYLVTNSGNVTLSGPFTVSDDQAADESCPATATLAPGASITCTATDTVTQQDIDNGSIVNIASASNGTITSPTDTATVNAVQTPSVALVKTASPTTVTGVGQTVDYTFVVTNNGGVTLTGIGVTDPMPGLSAVTCGASTLAPTASTTCTANYTTTQADINAGMISNTATATGTLPQGGTVTDTDSAVVTATQAPQITVVKTTSETPYSTVGRVLTFTVTVTNNGNVTLSDVAVTDPNATIASCSLSLPATLAPGETMTCTASHTTTQADLDNGAVQNIASASGTSGLSTTVSDDSNIAVVAADRMPAITLSKSTTATSFNSVGQQITYTLTATNTGNVTLTGVTIADPNAVMGTCTPTAPTTLAPGQSLGCSAVHTVTQADIDARSIANTAHVDGDMGILDLSSNSNTVVLPRGAVNRVPGTGSDVLKLLPWTGLLIAVGTVLLVIGKRRKVADHTS